MNKWVSRIIAIVLFFVFMALIVTGQRTVGVPYLIRMLVGLVGLIGMLYYYNKQHQ